MENLVLSDQLPTFSSPIHRYKVPYNETFRSELIKECIKWHENTDNLAPQMAIMHAGWQSEHMLFKTKDPSLRKIAQFISKAVLNSAQLITSTKDLSKYNLNAGGWINVNKKGTLHRPHIHGESTLSGVFYVKIPKEEDSKTNNQNRSSLIEFIDPRNSVESFANKIPELLKSLSFCQRITIEPKEGDLIIFPGWLKHWVYPNPSSDTRISISFNTSFSIPVVM